MHLQLEAGWVLQDLGHAKDTLIVVVHAREQRLGIIRAYNNDLYYCRAPYHNYSIIYPRNPLRVLGLRV